MALAGDAAGGAYDGSEVCALIFAAEGAGGSGKWKALKASCVARRCRSAAVSSPIASLGPFGLRSRR